jgi:hypothetical protein
MFSSDIRDSIKEIVEMAKVFAQSRNTIIQKKRLFF